VSKNKIARLLACCVRWKTSSTTENRKTPTLKGTTKRELFRQGEKANGKGACKSSQPEPILLIIAMVGEKEKKRGDDSDKKINEIVGYGEEREKVCGKDKTR